MANIGIFQLGIVCFIVILLFGSKKLRNLGADLGFALKNFKQSFADNTTSTPPEALEASSTQARTQDKV